MKTKMCCQNCCGIIPGCLIVNTVLLIVLALGNLSTDWWVCIDFIKTGFNNPLLPPNADWKYVWITFALVIAITTLAFVIHTVVDSCFEYRRRRWKRQCKHNKDNDEPKYDPCNCSVLAKVTLSAVTLCFLDVPLTVIASLYAYSQFTCKAPDARDVTPALRSVAISASVAAVAALCKTILSVKHYWFAYNSCYKKCCVRTALVLHGPFFVLLVSAMSISWFNYGRLRLSSLDIYRQSPDTVNDTRLFNISGIIIPPNGSFVNLEQIPSMELESHQHIFCLSEFEYRREDYQIYMNVIQLSVLSNDSHFCVSTPIPNHCAQFYTHPNSTLYYASVNPVTGKVERFDDICIVVKLSANYHTGPVLDSSIDIARHINRTGFPENEEPLIIYYPEPVDFSLNMSLILSSANQTYSILHTFQDLNTSANATCLVQFEYDDLRYRVNFNYRNVSSLEQECDCSFVFTPGSSCRQFHENLVYAYISQDGDRVPLTQCSTIPREKLVPYHDPTIRINVDCSLLCDEVPSIV